MKEFDKLYNKIINESLINDNNLTEDEIRQKLIKIEEKMKELIDSYYGNPPYNESQELTKKHKILMKQLARIKSGYNANPSNEDLQKISKYKDLIITIENCIKNMIIDLENEINDFKNNKLNFSEANMIYQRMKYLQKTLKDGLNKKF